MSVCGKEHVEIFFQARQSPSRMHVAIILPSHSKYIKDNTVWSLTENQNFPALNVITTVCLGPQN